MDNFLLVSDRKKNLVNEFKLLKKSMEDKEILNSELGEAHLSNIIHTNVIMKELNTFTTQYVKLLANKLETSFDGLFKINKFSDLSFSSKFIPQKDLFQLKLNARLFTTRQGVHTEGNIFILLNVNSDGTYHINSHELFRNVSNLTDLIENQSKVFIDLYKKKSIKYGNLGIIKSFILGKGIEKEIEELNSTIEYLKNLKLALSDFSNLIMNRDGIFMTGNVFGSKIATMEKSNSELHSGLNA